MSREDETRRVLTEIAAIAERARASLTPAERAILDKRFSDPALTAQIRERMAAQRARKAEQRSAPPCDCAECVSVREQR